LAAWAQQLAAEAEEAENEIAERPDLLCRLGLPRKLLSVVSGEGPLTPAPGRVIRFDFHPATDGWRLSEANSDVPGGFSEASHFTGMMATHFLGFSLPGNPANTWTDALCEQVGTSGVVVLLSAPGYMEDHQVVSFLASRLRERGCQTHLAKPEQLVWREGHAHLNTAWHSGPVDAIIRFYQAEWISRLPDNTGWRFFFRNGKTPIANPPLSIITESKRFPLVWDSLSTPLKTWRALLPDTRDHRDAPWLNNETWLLKTALCNTGDTVSIRALMPASHWFRTRLSVLTNPARWVAQRRFVSVPITTPVGSRHVCVGVYTVNGRVAGAYARLSEKPVIDFAAVDVALLIEDDE
jgi:glutathionylspermidine synthase